MMMRRSFIFGLAADLLGQSGVEPAPVVAAVDARIELMTVVQLLADCPWISQLDSPYRQAALAHFGRFSQHAAVRQFRTMSSHHFRYDAVPRNLLAYAPPPGLAPLGRATAASLRRAGGQQRVNDFVAALRDFASVSEFTSFLDKHRPLFDSIGTTLGNELRPALSQLERYSGHRLANCTLIPGLMIHNGGFQATILENDGQPHHFAIIGPYAVEQGVPVFSRGGSVAYVAQHEFSHSYVNPWVYGNRKLVARWAHLFGPVREAMKKENYSDWPTTVHEHIVRAITARLAALRNAAYGEQLLREEEGRGFRYVRHMATSLQHFEANRGKFPTITDYFPTLLESLRS